MPPLGVPPGFFSGMGRSPGLAAMVGWRKCVRSSRVADELAKVPATGGGRPLGRGDDIEDISERRREGEEIGKRATDA
jgi:hypothetical protein